MAKLYFRYGAMNSGKTTALLQVAFNYKERGMRVLILKASIDTKGGDRVVSRLGVSCPVDALVPPETDILQLVEADIAANGRPACVLCDESQFFTPAQAEQLFLVTVDLGIPVICYGLRADFMNRGFPGSTRLLELAHSIPGCLGARLSGGGFGGITIHLVEQECAAEYGARLQAAYRLRTGIQPEVIACSIGDGATARKL